MGPTPSDNVLLTDVVPALGAVVSLLMYASPVQAVLGAQRARSLGDLNTVPFAVTVATTIVWCNYGLVTHDPYVTAPNATGVVIGLFCALTCLGLGEDRIKERIRLLLCVEGGILTLLGVLTVFAASSPAQKTAIWGLAGNAISLVYYASPLSTMAEVIRTRNSASILLPMTGMNTANAALWTTYGLAMWDIYIILPNGIGLLFSLALIALAVIFPRRPKPSATPSPGTPMHDSLATLSNHSAHSATASLLRPEGPYARVQHSDQEEGLRLPPPIKT